MYPSEIHKTIATNQAQKHSVHNLCDIQYMLHTFQEYRSVHNYNQININSDTFIDFFL